MLKTHSFPWVALFVFYVANICAFVRIILVRKSILDWVDRTVLPILNGLKIIYPAIDCFMEHKILGSPGLIVIFVKFWVFIVDARCLIDDWVLILHRVFGHADLRLRWFSWKIRLTSSTVRLSFSCTCSLGPFLVDTGGCRFRSCFGYQRLLYSREERVSTVHVVVSLYCRIVSQFRWCVSFLIFVALGSLKHKDSVFRCDSTACFLPL